MNKIGFIGAGNMATAIISGISKANLNVDLYAFDLDRDKIESLSKYSVKPHNTAKELVVNVKYLFLAIKPQNFSQVLADIKDSVTKDIIIISIAAGITGKYISSQLGFDAKIIQVMPNTPLLIGFGATALSRTSLISDDEFNFVQKIFNCAGMTEVVPQDKMNEIIAINGSSPAFIYEFARCFIEYGKSVGIDENICLKLFSQTLVGSAKMITESGYTINELITMVSSKGGTTIAGLVALKQNDLEGTVLNACEKCVERAYELTK